MKPVKRYGNPKLFFFSYQRTFKGYDFSIALFGIHYFSLWGHSRKERFLELWERWLIKVVIIKMQRAAINKL